MASLYFLSCKKMRPCSKYSSLSSICTSGIFMMGLAVVNYCTKRFFAFEDEVCVLPGFYCLVEVRLLSLEKLLIWFKLVLFY